MRPIRTLTPLSVSGQATPDDDGPDPIGPEIRPHFEAWKAKPAPGLAGAYLKSVSPIIDAGIAGSGGADGPLARSRAKKIVLDASATYDPAKGALKPYLMSNLQRLKRDAAQRRQVLGVPERVAMEHTSIGEAENELSDRLGRPATTAELADHTGLSAARIGYVRGYQPGLTEGQVTSRVGADGEEMTDGPAVVAPDMTHARLQYLYDGLDPVDRAIAEHRYGLHGRPKLSGNQLAAKFGLSPGAISQRTGKIQMQLDDLERSGVF